MKVFVTGADGLLGSNLVRELLEQNHRVKVFVHRESKSKTLEGLKIEYSTGNILNRGEVFQALQGCGVIIHVAASTALWPPRDPRISQINISGTRNVLDACAYHKVDRLIHVGSASSFGYGSKENPGTEKSPYSYKNFRLAYFDSKLKAQNLVLQYAREKNLNAVVVNPTFMLGPYDPGPSSGKMITQFIEKGLSFYPPGGRNFVHVKDVAKGILSAIEKGRKGECYILGNRNLEMKEFFELLGKITGLPSPRYPAPQALLRFIGFLGTLQGMVTGRPPFFSYEMAKCSLVGSYYSPQKAIQELHLPQTPIETAIEEAYDWFRKNGYLSKKRKKSRDLSFHNQVALITGSSRGIGFAVAQELASSGARVVLNGREKVRLEKAHREMEKKGFVVDSIQADVSSPEECSALIKEVVSRFGKLDILINNAGISMRSNMEDLDARTCKHIVDVNLMGTIYPTLFALPHLKSTEGSIVFISSLAGILGLPTASLYCATKTSLNGLAGSLRCELAEHNIHVGIVYVGFTENDPEKRIIGPSNSLIPSHRPAHMSQEEVAKKIAEVIYKRKKYSVLTRIGKFSKFAVWLFPSLVEKAIILGRRYHLGEKLGIR